MSPSRSTRTSSGLKPGPERRAPGDVHRRALGGQREPLDAHAVVVELERARADHEVGVEAVRPQRDRVDHVDRAVQERLVERARRAELDLEIARQLVDRRAQQRLQQLEVEVAADLAGELPRVAVEPAVRAQVAAVGGQQDVVEIDALAAHGDVDRLGGGDAHALHGGLAVGPLDRARDRQRQLLQQQVDRQRLARARCRRRPARWRCRGRRRAPPARAPASRARCAGR